MRKRAVYTAALRPGFGIGSDALQPKVCFYLLSFIAITTPSPASSETAAVPP